MAILRGDLGGTWSPRFLLGPLVVPPSFFLNFPFKFVWLTYTVDNFRPEIFLNNNLETLYSLHSIFPK